MEKRQYMKTKKIKQINKNKKQNNNNKKTEL